MERRTTSCRKLKNPSKLTHVNQSTQDYLVRQNAAMVTFTNLRMKQDIIDIQLYIYCIPSLWNINFSIAIAFMEQWKQQQ